MVSNSTSNGSSGYVPTVKRYAQVNSNWFKGRVLLGDVQTPLMSLNIIFNQSFFVNPLVISIGSRTKVHANGNGCEVNSNNYFYPLAQNIKGICDDYGEDTFELIDKCLYRCGRSIQLFLDEGINEELSLFNLRSVDGSRINFNFNIETMSANFELVRFRCHNGMVFNFHLDVNENRGMAYIDQIHVYDHVGQYNIIFPKLKFD